MGSNQFRLDVPRLLDLYLDGRLQLDDMISHHVPLDNINESYDQMSRVGAVTRSVVTF